MPLCEWPRITVVHSFLFGSQSQRPIDGFRWSELQVVCQIVLRSARLLIAVEQPIVLARSLLEQERTRRGGQGQGYIRQRLVISVDHFHADESISTDFRKLDAKRLSGFVVLLITVDDSRTPVRPFLSVNTAADANPAVKLGAVGSKLYLRNRLIWRSEGRAPETLGRIA